MKKVPFIIFSLILLTLPACVGFNDYYVFVLTTVMIFATAAAAWDMVAGIAGQLDLAAFSYFGLGAYMSGMLIMYWSVPFWISMVLGGLIACGFAIIYGYPTFRFGVAEVWYALSSIATVVALRTLFLVWVGPIEAPMPFLKSSAYFMIFDTNTPYYYFLVSLLLVTLLISFKISRSKIGYFLRALREDETAAETAGVDVRKYKLRVLMIYAFILGVLGAIYPNLMGYLHPNFFSINMTLTVAVMGIVGGLDTIYGGVLASFLLIGTREFFRIQFGAISGLAFVVWGVLLILVVLLKPEGIAPAFKSVYDKFVQFLGGQ